MHHKRPESSEKEETDVHNSKGKGGLEQRTCLVWIVCETISLLYAVETKGSQREHERAAGEITAILCCDSAQLVDTRDQGAEKAEIQKTNKYGRTSCVGEPNQSVE